MKWFNPEEILPEDRENIAVLVYHNKHCWPMSAEIYFGEVESYTDEDGVRHVRALNNDFIGGGGVPWYLTSCDCYTMAVAWAYAKDFQRPDFIDHDPHWGKEKL